MLRWPSKICVSALKRGAKGAKLSHFEFSETYTPSSSHHLRAFGTSSTLRGWSLFSGLKKTKESFLSKLGGLFSSSPVTDELLQKLEEALLTSDVGVRTTMSLMEKIRANKSQFKTSEDVRGFLRSEMMGILEPVQRDLNLSLTVPEPPAVVLVTGVNGVGKTTSLGKLVHRYKSQGKSVLVAAADTFRAAAVQQLQVWGERTNTPVVAKLPSPASGTTKASKPVDPASVVYTAVVRGMQEKFDVVFCDTAGRLQNKVGLMNELERIHKSCGKLKQGAPEYVFLVLDSTTGQNAISQARAFNARVKFNGIILTKLDGSARGGVVLGIVNELKVPIWYVGVGEGLDDLKPFEARDFVDALLGEEKN